MVMGRLEDPNTVYRPVDLANEICLGYDIHMSYQKAKRARELALEYLRGSYEDSYAKLATYSYNLANANHGIVYHLQVKGESCFKYFFLAFGTCIRGFQNSIRPVVVVDGTFLMEKYKGILFVATCQDENLQIYSLAWGIVDSENDVSWHWFFTKLKEVTGDEKDLVIIFDQNRSLINVVGDVYQNAHHGHCIYHIKSNLRTACHRKAETTSLFVKVAQAYTIEEFENYMSETQSIEEIGWRYLIDTKLETWAMLHFQGNQYNIITSNFMESLNSLFKKEHEGPILALIESIGNKLQK